MKTNKVKEVLSLRMLIGLSIGCAASLCVLEYGKPLLGEKRFFAEDWEADDVIEIDMPITRKKIPEPTKQVVPVRSKKVLLAAIDPDQLVKETDVEVKDPFEEEFTFELDPDMFFPEPEPVEELPLQFLPLEDMPQFPGGEEGLFKYLSKTVKYPAIMKDIGMQGTVYVKFIVGKDGKVEEESIEIQRTNHPSFSEEARKAVANMPKWKPGKQRGKPVRVYYNLPIKFTLR